MKFSIRDLLLVTVIVALAVGWWVDHRRLSKVIDDLRPRMFYTGDLPDTSLFKRMPNSSAPALNPPQGLAQ